MRSAPPARAGPQGTRSACCERDLDPGRCAWRARYHRRRDPAIGSRFRPKSKRQPVVELPRLRLPLPERTGSDRDELHCPHGFVDRAYSVFFTALRCYEPYSPSYYCRLDLRPSPLFTSAPQAPPHDRAVKPQGFRIEGTSPPGAGSTRDNRTALPCLRWRSGRPRADGGARPARGAFRTLRPHSPSEDLLPPLAREPAAAHDPYPRGGYCRLYARQR